MEIEIKDNKIKAPLKGDNVWLEATPEEIIRQKFIQYLIDELGYNYNQMAQELKVTNSQRGTGRASADIVIWKTAEAKDNNELASIVVECKSDNVTIQPADYYQGLNYATWVSADFFITHNSKETRCFQVHKEKIPKNLGTELSRIPSAEELLDDKKERNYFKMKRYLKKMNLLNYYINVIM
ncbi:type I restriction enzyme HsdR N-terminal domain-containing protein [Flavobacterium oreochromis]|uniref:type I restriction enzyme HsdR N-terminal domain-containing protein n=1 Tax=Flavobacterium oreochromis TaxID=2906078 RepID=UPI002164E85D|nr:type I restriction enzyme HsdR N-terminal domain-containing protein [Flavobacterium oreochromis]